MKPAIVMFGRFQPPTIGHYKVINKIKSYLYDHPGFTPIIAIIDGEKSSQDKSKNPLTVDERIKYLKAHSSTNGVKIISANDLFDAIAKIEKMGFTCNVIAAGSDRSEKYLSILNKHFPHDGVKYSALKNLDRTDDENTAAGASGTLARQAAELGYEDTFAEITGLTDKPKLAKRLFNLVAKRIKE